jgi:tetratricopeptide (TPR) repeat protein/DNA-binding SARP family transcriptional activator
VEIEVAGTVRTPLRRRERCLLALLLLELNRVVPVDRLGELLWDGEPPERARRIVHGHVSRIRAFLADAGAGGNDVDLATVGRGYRLSAQPAIVDAHRFRTLVEEAREISGLPERMERLQAALALWRGPAMDNAASDWLRQRMCSGLEELRLTAVEELMSGSLALRRERIVLPQLAMVAAEQPGRERLVALHMRALYQAGRKAEALEVYRRARTHLAEQYGLDPGTELRDLNKAIVRDQLAVPAAATGADHPPRPASGGAGTTEPGTSGTVVPRQLPADVIDFLGRGEELERIQALALDAGHLQSGLVIAAIDGLGGVGKTALAVHAAHRVADGFPDGQLFLDLRGFTEKEAPVQPIDALERLLAAVGVHGQQIPPGLDERAGLWRSVLAGRKVLLVLDNAASAAQVGPLLPGRPGCLVIVTSRRRLAGLPVTVRQLSLDVLPPSDAATLFTRVAGPGRIDHHQLGRVAEVVELCWRLPLALSIAATILQSRPVWTIAHLIDRLRDEHLRLSELADGPRSVTVVLQVSYRQLSPDEQRFYRLLALHPGPDIDTHAAAALTGTTLGRSRRLLDRLLEERLLLELTAGRYGVHDLVRGHACEVVDTVEAEPVREAAVCRLLDYYRQTAATAAGIAYPHDRDRLPQLPAPDHPVPDLADPAGAVQWLDTELPNLLAVADHGAGHGWPGHTVHLSSILSRHLFVRGRYRDAEVLHRNARTLARVTGHRDDELYALNGLGDVLRLQGRWEQAVEHYQRALEIAHATGNRYGESDALNGLGHVHRTRGRYQRAMEHHQQALEIARSTSHHLSQLDALNGLGHVHRAQGRYQQATEHHQQAIEIARSTGHRLGELYALYGLGNTHRLQGRHQQAAEYYQQVLEIARTTGHQLGELYALYGLGNSYWARRHYQRAVENYQLVLEIARTTGHGYEELGALIGLGHGYRLLGQHERADTHYQRALATARRTSDDNLLVEALFGLGRLRHAIGDADAALAYHSQALELAADLGQPDDRVRAHDGLARAYHALHRYDQARRHWQRALAILSDLGTDHTQDPETTGPAIRARLAALDQDRQRPTST